MEKNKMEILDELASALNEVRSKVDQLEELVVKLRQGIENEQEMRDSDDGLEIPEDIEDITDMDIVAEDIPEVVEDIPEIKEPGALFGEGDLNSEQASLKSPVFLDVMASKHSWKNDIPGPEVKDVRSAISLNDRVLFINSLFGEDPMKFQSALNAINSMTDFSEAENFLMTSCPEWNFDSDIVYRFMMAIRRKLR
ncbi:MAG: hypothetical protein ACI4TM_02470 [Candidatus Cryptobacteroides sp.]